jgi:hypothetical protein
MLLMGTDFTIWNRFSGIETFVLRNEIGYLFPIY